MAKKLLATQTASSSSSLSFTTGIDSTYSVYEFHLVNMHPATDNVGISFQVNASGGSGFNETITSSYFRAWHSESDSSAAIGYNTTFDKAQGTSYQHLISEVGNDNDQSTSGVLTLYGPSSTTYVKHFTSRMVEVWSADSAIENYSAGYINTTSAIDEINFKFASGNIDAGTIKMYGVG